MLERRGGGEMWWRGEGDLRRCGEEKGSLDVVERRGGGEMWWRGEREMVQ